MVYRLLAATLAAAAFAGVAPEAQGNPAQDAWRTLQDTDTARERDDRDRRQQQLAPALGAPAAPANRPPAGRCRPVAKLVLRGNTLLDNQALQAVAAPHLAPCMAAPALNQLLAALTRAYVNAGFIAARPYLLPASATPGALGVVIVEGRVERVDLAKPGARLSLNNAFGDLYGKPLHLPTLERGLHQINRMRGFELVADIRPGATPGGSHLLLQELGNLPLVTTTLELDNSAPGPHTRELAAAKLEVDSPLGWNDRFGAGVARSVRAGSTFYRRGYAVYTVPRGAWEFTALAAQFSYLTALLPGQAARGHGGLHSLELKRELHRSGRAIATFGARVTDKYIDNSLGGHHLAVQSPRYRSADLTLDLLYVGATSFSGQLRYSEGLGGWSANDGQKAPLAHAPSGRFQSWGLQLGHTYASQAFGQAWQWNSQLTAQYSDDTLPMMDLFSLTGRYAVRGFRDQPAAIGTGYSWNNTLTFPRRVAGSVIATPRVGLDAGQGLANSNAPYPVPAIRLAGAALGVNLRQGNWQLDLDYQHPLYNSQQARRGGSWQASLSVHF